MSALGPLLDWQFLVVTVAAGGAAWSLVRPLLRKPAPGAAPACTHCASGQAACAAARKRQQAEGGALVTIGARPR